MSLVGPRPEQPGDRLGARVPVQLLRPAPPASSPGITGWAPGSLRLRRQPHRDGLEALPRPLLPEAALDDLRPADHGRDPEHGRGARADQAARRALHRRRADWGGGRVGPQDPGLSSSVLKSRCAGSSPIRCGVVRTPTTAKPAGRTPFSASSSPSSVMRIDPGLPIRTTIKTSSEALASGTASEDEIQGRAVDDHVVGEPPRLLNHLPSRRNREELSDPSARVVGQQDPGGPDRTSRGHQRILEARRCPSARRRPLRSLRSIPVSGPGRGVAGPPRSGSPPCQRGRGTKRG